MWKIAKGCVIGQGHTTSGLPCQDYCADRPSGPRSIIAIADGAGSAKYAERGAKIAVEVVLEELAAFSGTLDRFCDDQQAARWLQVVKGAISAEALRSGDSIGDFATTLLFAVLEGNEGYFWQVGDGGWVVDVGGVVQAATWPFTGQYVNETVFITSDEAVDRWVHAHINHIDAVVGFSDGLDPMFLDRASHSPNEILLRKIFSYIKSDPPPEDVDRQVRMLLDAPIIAERSDDDKTLVVAWQSRADAHG